MSRGRGSDHTVVEGMAEGQSWEQRALAAEASLQALRDKVVPLVNKTKELEKDAKVSGAAVSPWAFFSLLSLSGVWC